MSELTSIKLVILLVTNLLLVAGTVSLTLLRLRTPTALPARRDLAVVGCAAGGILLWVGVLLLPWASAPGDQVDRFTRAAGSAARAQPVQWLSVYRHSGSQSG
jgi:hypothetical protein